MVVKQLNEERRVKEKEYRARKEKERKERKEREAKAAAKGEGVKDGEAGEGKKDVEDKIGDTQKVDNVVAVKVDDKIAAVAPVNGGAVIVAPADPALDGKDAEGEKNPSPAERDAAHEAEPVLVVPAGADAGGEIKKAGDAEAKEKQDKAQKDQAGADAKGKEEAKDAAKAAERERRPSKPLDPVREAEMLAKLFGPEAAGLPLADLKAAFAAMEAAQATQKAEAAQAIDLADPAEPVIWMWSGPEGKCERWRWRNYLAGCGQLEEGCWEERDWKVFADGRGCQEYEEDEAWVELGEEMYDWSC